jgi:fucose permease
MVTGFIALKVQPVKLIRIGQVMVIAAVGLLLLPLPAWTAMPGLLLLGLGCAPIYPSMIHETPKRFGREASQTAMGLQMAFAYTGNTMMPPLLGFIAGRTGIGIFPYFLLGYALIMFASAEKLGSLMKRRDGEMEGIRKEASGME